MSDDDDLVGLAEWKGDMEVLVEVSQSHWVVLVAAAACGTGLVGNSSLSPKAVSDQEEMQLAVGRSVE